ncbi:MAG TPA: polysaccharide lyase family 7 protein [Polyangiaceae bacterium]|nr:polysaccharide lyase family 7 protein [Polyangiaceae bacterium]
MHVTFIAATLVVATCIGPAACAGGASGSSAGSSSASSSSSAGIAFDASGVADGAASGSDGSASGDSSDGGLRTNVAPGANFDLSLWELQLPIGSTGDPTTISPTQLEGSSGFEDAYFYTDPTDGAMTFWDPEDGVTTADSSYPRSELREMNADGTEANWPIEGTNTLTATLAVLDVPDHVCVGQIHIGSAIEAGLASSTKPLLELYYYDNGNIIVGIEDSPSGSQTENSITNVPPGTPFSYSIQLTGDGTITLTIDGATSSFPMPASFDGYGEYFKAGDYDQTAGADAAVGATVKFYALRVTHTSS